MPRGLGETIQLRCLETSFVISNMLTVAFPPKTVFSVASALMLRLFFLSCRLFFLMYAQSFLTTSVRGSGLLPTTFARSSLGVRAFMNAAFAFLAMGDPLLCAGFKSDRRDTIQHDFPSEINKSPSENGVDRPRFGV